MRPFALVLIDLDDFKSVNDTHGHDVGDQVLVAAADRVHSAAAWYGGHTARLAGDEFAMLVPSHGDADRVVELVLALIAAPVTAHIDQDATIILTVTASAGVCPAAPDEELAAALRRADIVMYHAKQTGGVHMHHQPGMAMPDPTSRKGPRLRDRHVPRQVRP